jgi:hypothetical protein
MNEVLEKKRCAHKRCGSCRYELDCGIPVWGNPISNHKQYVEDKRKRKRTGTMISVPLGQLLI